MKPIICNFCKRKTEYTYYIMKLSAGGKGKGDYDGNYNICITCVWKLMGIVDKNGKESD